MAKILYGYGSKMTRRGKSTKSYWNKKQYYAKEAESFRKAAWLLKYHPEKIKMSGYV